MKQRIVSLLLLTVLLLGIFAACGGDDTTYIAVPMMINDPIVTYEFGIAVFRGNEILRDQIWAALQVLSADGTVNQIARRWFGEDPTFIPPDRYATLALEDVRERTLIIGFDASNVPMSFVNPEGALVGFDIDLARAVCDYFGWTLELLPIDWADREKELASANIDALWGGVSLTERLRERLACTEPYMQSSQVVVTMSDRGVRSVGNTRGRYLAFRPSTMGELALIENATFANRLRASIPAETLTAALMALERGEVDAVLMDRWAADYFVSTSDTAAFGGRAPVIEREVEEGAEIEEEYEYEHE